MGETPRTLGELITGYRRQAGFTQTELAKMAQVSVRTVRNIERGRIRRPHADSLNRLTAAMRLHDVERDALLSAAGSPLPAGDRRMRLRVLGPLVVQHGDTRVDIGSAKQRLLLGLLAIRPGSAVSRNEIAELLWEDRPPRTGGDLVRTYVARLRKQLEAASRDGRRARIISPVHGGYRLNLSGDEIDLAQFDELAARARRARSGGDAERAHDLFAEALRCWHGPLLGEDGGRLRQHPAAVAAAQRRSDAALAYGDLAIELGRHELAATVLRSIIADEPFHEALHARVMLALAGAGQQATALRLFGELRARLAEELGIGPGAEINDAYLRVLRQEHPTTEPGGTRPAGRSTAPAQLPPAVTAFTGRVTHLRRLDALLPKDGDDAPRAVVISAIGGTAGIGKTALAVHWAHQVADRFPDGQLYVNLRGFEPRGSVMSPSEAIRGFIAALGAAPEGIPDGFDSQVGLYRSLMAGRRMLVVLDNARDVAQVRPLLPGASGCLVLVTSRDQLVGLIAAEGAHPLTVGLLTQAEARDLLIRRLGAGRVAGEPDAVDQIITRCARLPLALAMVAARAAVHHDFALDVLAEELHQARGLDALTAGDPASDLRAAFSWSYSALSHDAAWLFRLLSLHPGPDLALPAAASLAGLPAGDVRPLLAELTGAHLIAEHVPGRYGFHDLLRAYAAEQAHAADSQAERQAAVHRLLDHYLHTAHTGTLLLNPARDPMTLAAPQPGVTVTRLAGLDHAMAWLSAEHPGLVAIVEHAAAAGFDTHTWQLAWTLTTFLHRRGHWRDRVATHIAALAAAERLANKEAQARMHQGLANAYTQLGELEDALTHLWRALKLLTELSDHTGQANVHLNLAFVFERQGRRGQVLRHSREAIELYWTVGNRTGQARALNELGWHHALRGNYGQAWTYCEQALDLLRELNDRHGQAGALDSLGYIHHHTGDHGQAIACYRHSLDLLRDTGDRPHQAELLARLGETHHAAGDPGAARDTWTRALAILDEIGHPDADQVRTQLRLLGGERPARP